MKASLTNTRFRAAALLLPIFLSGELVASPQLESPGHFKVNSLHLEGGPSRDWVHTVLRDATGYLWVGTDNGLRRYDGYQYTAFTNSDDPRSLGTSLVYTLLIDSQHRLWVGGRALSVFNAEAETFDNYPLTDGNVIWGLAESPDGVLWIGTELYGLIGFDMRKREIIYHSLHEPEAEARNLPTTVTHIINDRVDPSIVWMTATTGLFRFDTRTFEFRRIFSTSELDHARLVITSMPGMDHEGRIWMTSENGLFRINPKDRTYRRYRSNPDNPRSLSTDILTSVFIDSRGRVWIGTDKQGAHIYQPASDDFIHIPSSATEPGTFGPAAINEIFEDDNGSMWFSVGTFGVQRISEHLEKFIAVGSGAGDKQLSWDLLMDIAEDRDGHVWIATDGGGLNRYDPATGKINKYFHDPKNPASLSSNSLLSLEVDYQGILWIGTWAGGLNRLDPKTGKIVRYLHDPTAPQNRTLGNNNIFQVVEIEKGSGRIGHLAAGGGGGRRATILAACSRSTATPHGPTVRRPSSIGETWGETWGEDQGQDSR
jgi:ligand-binding sensor domain-containing protein